MKELRVIPKLDIKGPNLVKTIFYEGLRVLGDPVFYGKKYYQDGADEIIYNDLVASLYDRNINLELIKDIKKEIFIPLIVGGGIRTVQDIEKCLASGADKVFLNTAIIENPEFLSLATNTFGSSTISVSIEASLLEGSYYCFKNGGRDFTKKKIIDWILEVQDRGAGELIVTSLDFEGSGNGYDIELYKELKEYIKIPLIVSGGLGSKKDLKSIKKEISPSGISFASSSHYKILNDNLKFIHKYNPSEGNLDYIKNYKKFFRGELFNIKEIFKELKNYEI